MKTLKIQIKSDIHEEFSRRFSSGIRDSFVADKAIHNPFYIHPDAEVLVLAGDIIQAVPEQIAELVNKVKDLTIPVIYVAGNHEYWDRDWNIVGNAIRNGIAGSNIIFLNQDCYAEIKGVIFIGATLWSDLSNSHLASLLYNEWSDGRWIKNFPRETYMNAHVFQKSYIEKALKMTSGSKVVVTHHLPSFKSVSPRFYGDESNCFYYSNCEEIILQHEPKLWIHGHTHDSKDYMIGNTRVVCNPYGYFPNGINPEYKRDLIIEVPYEDSKTEEETNEIK